MSSMPENKEWWRGCVIYQIYPRSFMDTNADGIGDLAGIHQKLDYVADLGVDAIWISPFFRSPMKDFGYDVSDYYAVEPIFGTLDDFKAVLDRAHEIGLKVLIDQVWSHTSNDHDWFRESRRDKTNSKHEWYVWADCKPDGTAPNNWLSYFGGPAWTWDSRREQYYLHHFLKEQPALNLWNPEVRQAIKDVAKYWLDMGVDGFRLDVAHTYLYDQRLRDNPPRGQDDEWPSDIPGSNPMARQRRIYSMSLSENLEWIEELRAYVGQWPERCLLAESGGEDSEREAARYTQTEKRFHMAYSFGLVGSHMHKSDIEHAVNHVQDVIDDGWMCWAVSNHDFKRVASRVEGEAPFEDKALFASMLGLSLRGSYCMYQGEELGLPQADLAYADLQDPYDKMLYPEHVGRDGCRTPMPWIMNAPQAGFSSARKTWLPVSQAHLPFAVDRQDEQKGSVLNRVRHFLVWRKKTAALLTGDIDILEMPDGLFGFVRTKGKDKIYCLFNCEDKAGGTDIGAIENAALIDHVSHNAELNDNRLSLSPFGFAFLTKSG